jgi:diaminopimelate epimerase
MIATKLPFTKMHGIGNDFVMLDLLEGGGALGEISDWSSLAVAVNDRRRGIGGDGLILMEAGVDAPYRMRMFNPDGSESEMCGNGIRCFARLLADRGHLDGDSADVETGAGRLRLELVGEDSVRVDMGIARLGRAEIGMWAGEPDPFIEADLGDGLAGTAVSMGNPHVVLFTADVSMIDLEALGPKLEHHPLFPNRVNVHFIEVVGKDQLKQRTWERGAGITLACGTGACASAVAALVTGRTGNDVRIDLPGGTLRIEIDADRRVFMTGPAKTVYTGWWPLSI